MNITSRQLLLVTTAAVSVCISACSSFGKKTGGVAQNAQPTEGEVYYTGGDRAPTSMSPAPVTPAAGATLDPMYLRTQADYHFTLAEAKSLEGNTAGAIEEYKLTLVYDPDSANVHLRIAGEYIKKGLISEALKHAEDAARLSPKMPEARFLLGGLYSSLKMYEQAQQQYQLVIHDQPENAEAYLYLGAILAEEEKYEEAISQFEKVAKFKSNQAPHLPLYYIGRIRMEMKQFDKARAAFEKCLAAKPEFTEGVLALGLLYEKQSHREMELKLYGDFQKKYGPNERVAEVFAKLLLEDENYTEAYSQYEIVSQKDPDNLNARVKLALILIEKKEYQPAIERLKEILALAPEADKIRFYLGAVYEEIKDFRNAIHQFQQMPVASIFYEEATVHAAYLYKLMGDFPKAIQTIEAGIKTRPDVAQFYALYASLLDDTKEQRKAVTMLLSAVDHFPQNDQLWFFLGSMEDKLGDKHATVAAMKRVVDLNPDHVQALNYLAYTYAELTENLDDALRFAEKAVSLKPNDAYIRDTQGWVLFKMGKFPDSVKALEAAYKLRPQESIIAEHLGDAYYQTQLPVKAKTMYQHAVELEKDVRIIEKLQGKIEAIEKAGTASPRMPASLEAAP